MSYQSLKPNCSPDDNPEPYELDAQLLGGYRVFEWKDIARELSRCGSVGLSAKILTHLGQGGWGTNADRVIVPCDDVERQLVLLAAAQVGC